MTRLLDERVALVTGGNGGIGKAIAQRFATEGATVVIFGTSKEKGDAAVAEINKEVGSERASFYQVDVSNTAAVKETTNKVIEKHGSVDVLVNNAGIARDNLLIKMKEEDWDRVLDVNLKSVYNTCHALTRTMMKARKGKMINITSVVGLTGNSGQANYSAAKAGMIGFTKSLAKELAARNICVNCVAPGYIDTQMTDSLSDKQKEEILSKIPMKRMGSPDDIASAVLFLASKSSDFLTGQVLTVDGGMVM
jgi:3-oxoacyl-[acyl-carrier protein] reductase